MISIKRLLLWFRHHLLIFSLAMVVLVSVAWSIPLSIALARSQQAATDAKVATDCVRSVVNQVITRSDALGNAAKLRDDALHNMMSFALSNPLEAQRIFKEVYLPAKANYDRVRQDNPVPETPELVCPR